MDGEHGEGPARPARPPGDRGVAGDPLLAEQLAYYRARAAEYDDWFYRHGRYDRGEELNAAWRAEVAELRTALAGLLDELGDPPDVLELACGTGLWTPQLAARARRLTAVDGSAEVLEVCRARLADTTTVELVQADLFDWQPASGYDLVFFSFWLSHVPPERLESFFELVRGALRPGGSVFLIDSAYDQTSTARDHRLGAPDDVTVERLLDDGRRFRIYKVFHQPDELAARLAGLGWSFELRRTAHYFIYGRGRRQER
jgi:demethylmenaquinone methyltransferase/2-methoxy-6-polyprenyl-1,4-benzoquinol methylase